MGTYGIDSSTYPKTDTSFRAMNDADLLTQQVLRKITTRAGDLWWAIGKTIDLRDLLGQKIFSTAEWEAKCESLFHDDPRMRVDFTITLINDSLSVYAVITGADGTKYEREYIIGSDTIEVKKVA